MKPLWPLLMILGLGACGDTASPTAPAAPPQQQNLATQPAPAPEPTPADPAPPPDPGAPPAPTPTPSNDNPPPPGEWGSNGFVNAGSPVRLCDDFRVGVSCIVLAFGPTSATIRVTNNNADAAQVRDVFFTVYKRNLPDALETQTKYAPGSAQALGLKPHQSAVLTATIPGCFVQLDVYVGPEVDTPPHAPYKLLGSEHVGGPDFCNVSSSGGPGSPTSVPAPTPPPPPTSPTPGSGPAPSPSASVCDSTAPTLVLTSAVTASTVDVTAAAAWTGTGAGTIAWGDTTSSSVSAHAPVTHRYVRQPTDTTFTAVLSVNVGGTMCSTQASVSVPKPTPICVAGKAAVLSPNITIEGLMAHATFSIAPGCSGIEVSLATYTAPAPTIAYPQSLFDSDHPLAAPPQKFNAGGPYTLSARMPACFWQVDLVLGQLIETLTVSHLYGANTIVFRNGGTVSCPAR